MRIAVMDPLGDGLSWAARLHDEGYEVMYYVNDRHMQLIGTNIVPKSNSAHQTLAWCKEKPSMAFFACTSMGKSDAKAKIPIPLGADEFRRAGIPVVGGGSFCDRLEEDREFGAAVVKLVGCKTPQTKTFGSVSAAIDFCKKQGDAEWYFKSDKFLESDATQGGTGEALVRYLTNLLKKYGDNIPNILQEKVEGTDLSTACWWNGKTFIGPFEGTMENKKFLNGNLGPSTGCQINAVWFYEDELPVIAKKLRWESLKPIFQKYDAPPGLYDINAKISKDDGEPYFLEFTPRNGWDSEAISHRLWLDPMGEVLTKLAEGRLEEMPVTTRKFAYSTRLCMMPYPYEPEEPPVKKGSCVGTPLYGMDDMWSGNFVGYGVASGPEGFYQAGFHGITGVSVAVGTKMEDMHDEVIDYAKSLEPKSMMYRTDGDKVIGGDAKALRALGYPVHRGV